MTPASIFPEAASGWQSRLSCGQSRATPKAWHRQENSNLQYVNETLTARKKMEGVPRVLGDFSDLGAVVRKKSPGLPVQSIIMKAALLPGFADNGSIACTAARRVAEGLPTRPLPMRRNHLTAMR